MPLVLSPRECSLRRKKNPTTNSRTSVTNRVWKWLGKTNKIIPSPPNDLILRREQQKHMTYRKHHYHSPLPLNHHGEVIPHFKPAKGLMNKDIHNLRRRDKARRRREEIVGRERTGLDAQGAEREEGFFYNREISIQNEPIRKMGNAFSLFSPEETEGKAEKSYQCKSGGRRERN